MNTASIADAKPFHHTLMLMVGRMVGIQVLVVMVVSATICNASFSVLATRTSCLFDDLALVGVH